MNTYLPGVWQNICHGLTSLAGSADRHGHGLSYKSVGFFFNFTFHPRRRGDSFARSRGTRQLHCLLLLCPPLMKKLLYLDPSTSRSSRPHSHGDSSLLFCFCNLPSRWLPRWSIHLPQLYVFYIYSIGLRSHMIDSQINILQLIRDLGVTNGDEAKGE